MLEVLVVRILAVVMALGTLLGVVAFSRRGHGPPAEFRATDNPPEILQVVWPLLVMIPQLYPFLVAALPGFFYAGLPRFTFPGDSFVQILGFLLWGAGGLLVLWAGRELGRFMMLQIGVVKDHRLIQTGPYARVRHPTYAGAMGLSFGVALLFLSYVLLAFAVTAFLVADYRARKEERLLSSAHGFGDAYRQYMERTGRFLPRLSK
ncbi:MAG TPA: isoprenylcysteine carboxylmethyltransferase family protein [Thermoplasmata archaeon]|nr:isoprenylcysteine carboxylmethyltransferase family protein [Thermoplasmata archaeon]